jgi:hypothetical protein
MVIARKQKHSAEEHIEEFKAIIRSRFPDAEFELYKRRGREYNLHVYGDFEDLYDVLDLTSERATDLLVDTGIWIHVLPLGRRRDNNS